MGERAGMIERAVMIVERGLLSIMPRGVGLQRGGSEPNLTGNSMRCSSLVEDGLV